MDAFEFERPNQVAAFRKAHAAFFAGSEVLGKAIDLAFNRQFATTENSEAVIFFLGNRCEEDFREIVLLAAHGHGWGATAHLRGMYERAVAAAYLHEHPNEVDDFIDFDIVRRWRAADVIKRTFNIDAEDRSKLEKLAEEYQEVKSRFEVHDCRKCGTKRVNHTWNKLDFVAMAGKVKTLGKAILPAYYMPLAQAHGTIASAAYRLAEGSDGSFFVDPDLSAAEGTRSFQYAHLLMLGVLTVQHEHFRLRELDEPLGKAWDHYRSAWGLPSE